MASRAIKLASALLSRLHRRPTKLIATGAAIAFALALGGITTAPESHAATAEPLCLYYAQSYCLETHGIYNQVTLSNTSYSYWTATYLIGGGEVMFQNDSGLCLREDNALNGDVVTGAACSAKNINDIWVFNTTSEPERYYNLAVGPSYGYLLVGGAVSGEPVYTGAPQSGLWWGWT